MSILKLVEIEIIDLIVDDEIKFMGKLRINKLLEKNKNKRVGLLHNIVHLYHKIKIFA